LSPYGTSSAAPEASTPDAEVMLPARRLIASVIGTAIVVPATGFDGGSRSASDGSKSVPSQPSVIEPNGARSTPPCTIFDAKTFRLPPAESGVAREPEPVIV